MLEGGEGADREDAVEECVARSEVGAERKPLEAVLRVLDIEVPEFLELFQLGVYLVPDAVGAVFAERVDVLGSRVGDRLRGLRDEVVFPVDGSHVHHREADGEVLDGGHGDSEVERAAEARRSPEGHVGVEGVEIEHAVIDLVLEVFAAGPDGRVGIHLRHIPVDGEVGLVGREGEVLEAEEALEPEADGHVVADEEGGAVGDFGQHLGIEAEAGEVVGAFG